MNIFCLLFSFEKFYGKQDDSITHGIDGCHYPSGKGGVGQKRFGDMESVAHMERMHQKCAYGQIGRETK